MDTSKHPNSHKITIHRLGNFLSNAQRKSNDMFFAGARESIGSYFENQNSHRVGSGLTMEEEKVLMPLVIDTEVTDRDFRKKVTEFFNDITTPVPYDTGVELEIGLEKDNSLPIAADNLPLNTMEFIRYRHAANHPWTAPSKEEGIGNQSKKYYIFDKEMLQGSKTKTRKEQDAAMAIYLKVKIDKEAIDQMLTLLGEDVRKYVGDKNAEENKLEKLHELMILDPVKFKETYDEGELSTRSWINGMIITGVLKKVGKRILDTETSEEIGGSMEEAIFFFLDEKNSAFVGALKARQQEAASHPVSKEIRKTVVNK